MKIAKIASYAVVGTLLIALLIATKDLMIPFVISLFLFVILTNATRVIASILPTGIKKRSVRNIIGALSSIALLVSFFIIVYSIISHSITSIVEELPKYEQILQTKIVSTQTQMDSFTQSHTITDSKSLLNSVLSEINIAEIITNALSSVPFEKVIAESSAILTNMAADIAMIIVYLMFLSLEYKHFISKMAKFNREHPRKMKKIMSIFSRINSDFITYIRVKFIASFFTGLLSFGVLTLFDVDFAPFWGFMLFLLNFIPTIGSIVAVSMPVALSVVQFSSIGMIFGLATLLTAIQFLIGNFLEPRYQGKVLNLSPLVILISLGIWGKIWGIIGMFLSVPMMVGINIILSQFPTTRGIASFLSASGELTPLINDDEDEIDRELIQSSIQI